MAERDEPEGLDKIDLATLANYRLVERLAESERRYQELLDDLPDVVVRLSASGSILYVNDAWRNRFGLDPLGSVGREFSSYLHPEDHEKFARLISAGTDQHGVDRILRVTDEAGQVRRVETRLRRIDGEEIVGILEDVTVRQQLETEQLRAQRLESIGRLAGGLAHDFNNLLSVVLGNLELARSRTSAASEGWQELEHASRACMQAAEIAKQMLAFSKGGAPKRSPEDLGQIVREAFELYLRGSGVTGVVEVEEGVGLAEVDSSQMHQVLNTLLLNAIDAMPSGGRIHGQVRSTTTGDGKPGVLLLIRDEGEGIPPDQLEQVFEPYFTTKETGNGLGLTSTYAIVTRHGGTLEVESEVGVGTEFRICLEAVEGEVALDEAEADTAPQQEQARILVMDDDEMVRGVLVSMLRSLGHQVAESHHGQECLDAYQAAGAAGEPFDLVLLDLTIVGGHDGLWTIAHLREVDPGVRALVVTGYNNAPVVADPSGHGFVGSVTKPTTLGELRSRILAALSGDQGSPTA